MGLTFLWPMDIDSSGPPIQACRALFLLLSSSVASFTPFGLSLSAEGGQLGWRSNKYMLTVLCSWVDGRDTDMNGDKFSLDDGWKCWVDGGIINGVMVEISSGRWRGSLDDGSRRMRSSGVQSSDKLSRGIYGVRHMSFVDWLVSRIEASLHLSCTPSIKTNTLPLISLLFAKNTLSKRVLHPCQRSIHSTTASLDLICSLFSSVSDSIRSICLFFLLSFSNFLVKVYVFCARHPFSTLLVLRFVTTCRQCLVRQVTNCSSVTGELRGIVPVRL